MNIKYTGIADANIEGRYNDILYFIEKIISLESEFSLKTSVDHVVYNDTEEFDSIKLVPYEKGAVFEISNVEDETDYSNNTIANLVVSDTDINFVIVKADWDHNRNPLVEQQAIDNVKLVDELKKPLGKLLEIDYLESKEKTKDWLINFAHQRKEKIQKKAYADVFGKTFSNLKEAVHLFSVDGSLKSLEDNQVKLKQESDNKELLKKQIDSIPEDKMEILYQYSSGAIDRETAIARINALNDAEDNKVTVSEEDIKKMLDYVIQGDINNKKE